MGILRRGQLWGSATCCQENWAAVCVCWGGMSFHRGYPKNDGELFAVSLALGTTCAEILGAEPLRRCVGPFVRACSGGDWDVGTRHLRGLVADLPVFRERD